GNFNLIVLSFGQLAHSFKCWTCACPMYWRKMTFK
ncbi:hypothetical protein P781_16150, partial [Vibrio mimicus CAIM 1883]